MKLAALKTELDTIGKPYTSRVNAEGRRPTVSGREVVETIRTGPIEIDYDANGDAVRAVHTRRK